MIRVVAQHSPSLFAILGLFPEEEAASSEIIIDHVTYYRAETHDRWVLFKRAISGWGAVTKQPGRPGGSNPNGPDRMQR